MMIRFFAALSLFSVAAVAHELPGGISHEHSILRQANEKTRTDVGSGSYLVPAIDYCWESDRLLHCLSEN